MSASEEEEEYEEQTHKTSSEFALPSGKHSSDGKKKTKESIKLRACLSCHVILGEQQFLTDGCPNCEYLNLNGHKDLVQECTSTSFDGILTVVHPTTSWVARYHNLKDKVPGCYAMTVHGTLPDSVREPDPED